LNYIGPIPSIENFNYDVSEENYFEYIKEKKNVFDLKKETIEYCENDVKITYNLIKKIIEIMNKKYINIFKKSYSAPSLSYKIFFKY
jgi:putative IMPACT (imprinted ancient) family translation regulator